MSCESFLNLNPSQINFFLLARSPIFSHLTASLNGLATIRAFKAEPMLIEEFDNHQDLHSSAYYLFIAAARAFGFALDGSCLIYVTIIILSFFLFNESGGNVGLVITQILGMTGMVQWGKFHIKNLMFNENLMKFLN